MIKSWIRPWLAVSAAAVIAIPWFATADLEGQAVARSRVMVMNLVPEEGADDDFGKDFAKAFRNLLKEHGTHSPIEEKEIRDAAKQFKIDYGKMGCIQGVQLASQVRAQLVLCGHYTEDRDQKTIKVRQASFTAPGGGPDFELPPDQVWSEKEAEEAAQAAFASFDEYVDQRRTASFCADYFQSKEWARAETQCREVLETVPDDIQSRYILANVLRQEERLPEAYEETVRVIELDPLHEDAHQLAGYLAVTTGDTESARRHYHDYLELKPDNASVRMSVAYDLAKEGDPEGAMILIEEGLELEPDNTDLLLQRASFATTAALARQEKTPDDAEEEDPMVTELFSKAIDSYGKTYAVLGAEMDVAHLRQMIVANMERGLLDDALAAATQVLGTHDQANIWSLKADILKRQADAAREAGSSDQATSLLEEAVAALGEVETREPSFLNLRVRRARWLLESGHEEESVPDFVKAIEVGEQTADAVGTIIFAQGYTKGFQAQRYSYALMVFSLSDAFRDKMGPKTQGQLDFWSAFSLYNIAMAEGKAETIETAKATLPKFQRVARLLQSPGVTEYVASQASLQGNLQQIRDANQVYIEIQEAIIERG